MHETRYLTPSKNSRPRRRSYLWWGIGLVVIVLCLISLPVLTRSNRAFIQQKIQAAQKLPDTQRESALRSLVRASGGDQEASRALAEFYVQQLNYRAASQVYRDAHPAMLTEALTTTYETYDFKLLQQVAEQARNQKIPRAVQWQIIAQYNLGNTTKGCDLVKAAASNQDELQQACDLLRKDSLSPAELFRLNQLNVPAIAVRQTESLATKTSSDYLLLAHYYQRLNQPKKVYEFLNAGFEHDPWNAELLDTIKKWCDTAQGKSVTQSTDLGTKVQRQSQYLIKI